MTKATILVIDPSPDTRKIYSEYFTYHGYAVAQAASGEEGARLSAELSPDVIVTELSDREQWVQSIRRGPRHDGREAVIIACSTLIDASWPFVPPGRAVDCALGKPTSLCLLLDQVQHLLAQQTCVAVV